MVLRKIRKRLRKDDPVYNCEVYEYLGCSHVDGFLCDLETCSTLKDFKEELERKYKLNKLTDVIKNNTRL